MNKPKKKRVISPIAVIGGSGVYHLEGIGKIIPKIVATPFGKVSVGIGTFQGKNIVFLNRHGKKHSVAPHLINYRANIWALKKIGVKKIIATNSVGSLDRKIRPGDFILPNQFIDFTKSRISTFFGKDGEVHHADMTSPYCQGIKKALKLSAKKIGVTCHNKGTMVVTEGPRFETAAEISMFRKWGADIVGMTGVPEIVLARELGICYSSISIISNFAAGISNKALTLQEVMDSMQKSHQHLSWVILEALGFLADEKCTCWKK